MRAIRVTFDDGSHLETNINGTDKEIRDYYLGQSFEIEHVSSDGRETKTATQVDFLND